jgi:hypothetical protein
VNGIFVKGIIVGIFQHDTVLGVGDQIVGQGVQGGVQQMDAPLKVGYFAVVNSRAAKTVYYNPPFGIVAGNGMAAAVEKDIGCLDDDAVAGGRNILRQQDLYSGVGQLAGAVAAGIAGFLGLDPIGQPQQEHTDEDPLEKSVGEGRPAKTIIGTWHFKSPYCPDQGAGFELKGILPMPKNNCWSVR